MAYLGYGRSPFCRYENLQRRTSIRKRKKLLETSFAQVRPALLPHLDVVLTLFWLLISLEPQLIMGQILALFLPLTPSSTRVCALFPKLVLPSTRLLIIETHILLSYIPSKFGVAQCCSLILSSFLSQGSDALMSNTTLVGYDIPLGVDNPYDYVAHRLQMEMYPPFTRGFPARVACLVGLLCL